MGFTEFAEIVICVFAVYGVYALLCRIISHGCYRGDFSVAVHLLEKNEVEDAVRRAIILTEAQNGRMKSPVLLLEEPPSADESEALTKCGCRLYSRIL